MPLETLADLIAAGAHRTLEQIVNKPGFDVAMAADYLSQRYHEALQPNPGVLPVLVGRVQDAVRAGMLTNPEESPLEAEIPELPGFPAGYTYTAIGYLKDPLRPADDTARLSFPVPIQSPKLLTFREVQEIVNATLEQLAQRGEGRFEGGLTESQRIRRQAAELVRREYEGEALPQITVLSVYRGA